MIYYKGFLLIVMLGFIFLNRTNLFEFIEVGNVIWRIFTKM